MDPSITAEPAPLAAAEVRDAPTAARTAAPTSRAEQAKAERVVSTSILISGLRCTFSYLIFPFVAPIVGLTGNVGPIVGITISVVAIVFNVLGIRRFWRADHKWKVPYTFVAVGIILAMLVLMGQDVADLLG